MEREQENFIGNVRRSADIQLAIVDYLGRKFRGKGFKKIIKKFAAREIKQKE